MTIVALAGCLGELAIIAVLVILLQLSYKLGDVAKMPRYYRGYYVAIVLVCVALAMRLVAAGTWYDPLTPLTAWLRSSQSYALVHHISLALGITLAAPITIKYWGWLLHES